MTHEPLLVPPDLKADRRALETPSNQPDSPGAADRLPALALLLITALAVCAQGYHLGADDAGIYVPGIKHAADPTLYAFGSAFFEAHARLTILPALIAGTSRLAHIPIDWAILAWYIAGVFLLLAAGWRLMNACFSSEAAKWGGVALLAASLSVPVAGTALVIADPYVTARTLSTPATLFSIAWLVSGRPKKAFLWWLVTALVHPQMGFFAGVFLLLLAAGSRLDAGRLVRAPGIASAAFSLFPFLFEFRPATGPAREALLSRTYFFVSQWAWYEWVGVAAPLALVAWFARADFRAVRPGFQAVTRPLASFGLIFTAAGFALISSRRLENYTRLQPMRSLHLIYVVLFLLLGGLAGEYVLRNKIGRWLALFAPLGISMYLLQTSGYPSSAHFEWPGRDGHNSWTAAFLWIRQNTPKDAVFALDPVYLSRPGEDMQGFRAVAERSMLADAVKDSGVVSLFPELGEEWSAEVRVAQGWQRFQKADFERLAQRYPVTWIVTDAPAPPGLNCPYRNSTVAVCQLSPSSRP